MLTRRNSKQYPNAPSRIRIGELPSNSLDAAFTVTRLSDTHVNTVLFLCSFSIKPSHVYLLEDGLDLW